MNAQPAVDAHGRDLQLGDWVRVIAVPRSVFEMPSDSKAAFSRAVGHTFQIEGFDETGCLELELWPKLSCDTIWIEPECVVRTRRQRQLSRSFQKKLALKATPPDPRLKLEFHITAREGVDLEQLGLSIMGIGTGGGFAVWPQERRLSGTIYANKSHPDPKGLLELAAKTIRESIFIESLSIGSITDAEI